MDAEAAAAAVLAGAATAQPKAGTGPMPPAEKQKLHDLVKRAHDQGRKVRFWSTAETPAVWKELLAAGVDYINTDKLDELQRFLLEK